MAVFSNLEGTMKKTFILGKNGARISTEDGTELIVQNYGGTDLIPVSAADPTIPSHLVTLAYFNAHTGGGGSGVLSGTTVPDVSLGVNGDMYIQVDDTSIVQIFFKDQSIWKPFKSTPPITDSDYVTAFIVTPQDFAPTGGVQSYSLPESIHKRGADILVQIQDPDGNIVMSDVTVDVSGNITISVLDVPSTSLKINLIGATTMTTPYSSFVNKTDWVSSGDKYTLSISAATHTQASGPLYLAIYENSIDSASASAPFNLVSADSQIDMSGNVVFTTYLPFSGKVVISGK